MTYQEKKRILIIDDEELNLNLFKRIFRGNYELRMFSSAEEGLLELEKKSFDVIITDFKLGGLNGLEFLKKSKTLSRDSMKILITGDINFENTVSDDKNENSFDYFFIKPYDFKDLLQVVEKKSFQT